MSKLLTKEKFLQILSNKKLKLVSKNIDYSNGISPKYVIRVEHICGKQKVLSVRKIKKYKCDCFSHNHEQIKICTLCEKPEKRYNKTHLCTSCHRKRKMLDVSINFLMYLKNLYGTKNVFKLIEEKPYLLKSKIDYKYAKKIKRETREYHRSLEYRQEKYNKWEGNIPSYIYDLFRNNLTIELITISGDKLNPNIHYLCKICKEEYVTKYKDLRDNKGHKCLLKKSSGEIIVENFLQKYVKIKKQHDTLKCINPITKRQLPYDIEIVNKKILVEIQGEQHLKYIEYFHGTIENFHYQQRKDDFKKRYAESKGYKLIYIYYDELQDEKFKNKFKNII